MLDCAASVDPIMPLDPEIATLLSRVRRADRLCRMLADQAHCIVVSEDYRFAPEHRFPVAVHDAQDALAWLGDQADRLGVDARRIAIGGDSAGGTLAAVTAIHARDAGIDCTLQSLIYPGTKRDDDTASHHAPSDGYPLDAKAFDWFMDQYAPTPAMRNDWRFAPLDGRGPRGDAIDLTGVAPACVVMAGFDLLHDEGIAYARRLVDAGVVVRSLDYAGMVHGFMQFGGAITVARQAHRDVVGALVQSFTTIDSSFENAS